VTSIKDLKSDHKNARKRTDRSASLIKESLERYGAARSIVIDEDNRILAGNGTIEGAKAAGIKNVRIIETDGSEVIAIKRSGLSEDEKVGLALADNRTADLSEWDQEMLRRLSDEHDLAPWFEAEDLDELLAATELPPEEGNTDPDDVPEAPEDPITKPGDLWVLGNHRLLCGDSTNPQHVERLMDGKLADLWLTDPPYNVALGMNESPEEAKRRNRRTDGKVVQNDSMPDEEFRQFLRDVYSTADSVLRPGAAFYIWHADFEVFNFATPIYELDWKLTQILNWVKPSIVMGRKDYHYKHEPCLYGWKQGAAHTWNSDRKQTTVLEFDKPSRNGEHPTMKPVDLFQYQLDNSSKPGQIVLDSFGGSGTTLIAAERIRRKARLMELDPRYCDVIVKRWEEFTGNTAVCEPSNAHFLEELEV
jgi:site-specific DNA-methyltransferase (adenine-specific)